MQLNVLNDLAEAKKALDGKKTDATWTASLPGPMRFAACMADELSVHRRGFPHSWPKSKVMRSRKQIASLAALEPLSSASGLSVSST